MTAPSGPSSLVTLDDVYAHLNIPSADQAGVSAELQGFINAAQAFVEFQTGPIVPQQFVEVYSGGSPTIALLNVPVLRVDEVIEYVGPVAYTLTECELGVPTGQYSFSVDDTEAGVICRRYTGGFAGSFVGGLRNIKVTYWAGRASVPADVRMATLEDIRGLYTQTQYGAGANRFGSPSAGAGDSWKGSSMNPIGTFPRLAALLAGPSRSPSIA